MQASLTVEAPCMYMRSGDHDYMMRSEKRPVQRTAGGMPPRRRRKRPKKHPIYAVVTILLLLIGYPIGLILLWVRRLRWSSFTKLCVSLVTGILFFVLMALLLNAQIDNPTIKQAQAAVKGKLVYVMDAAKEAITNKENIDRNLIDVGPRFLTGSTQLVLDVGIQGLPRLQGKLTTVAEHTRDLAGSVLSFVDENGREVLYRLQLMPTPQPTATPAAQETPVPEMTPDTQITPAPEETAAPEATASADPVQTGAPDAIEGTPAAEPSPSPDVPHQPAASDAPQDTAKVAGQPEGSADPHTIDQSTAQEPIDPEEPDPDHAATLAVLQSALNQTSLQTPVPEGIVISESTPVPEGIVISESTPVPEGVVISETTPVPEVAPVSETTPVPEGIVISETTPVSKGIVISESTPVPEVAPVSETTPTPAPIPTPTLAPVGVQLEAEPTLPMLTSDPEVVARVVLPEVKPFPFETIKVYYYGSSKWYHSKSACGSMRSAPEHSLFEAAATGKPPCDSCTPPSTTLLEASLVVWCGDDNIFHIDGTCPNLSETWSGMSFEEAMLEYGMTGCPQCGADMYMEQAMASEPTPVPAPETAH